jgi:hypothetical protein
LNLRAEEGLKWGDGVSRFRDSRVYTVIGPDEGFNWFCGMMTNSFPTVEDYDCLRPINDGDVHISRRVAFAHYNGCGHNVFFKYYRAPPKDFRAPSKCPLKDGGIIDPESEDLP